MTTISEKLCLSSIRIAGPADLPQDLAERVSTEAYTVSPTACPSCGQTLVRLRFDHSTCCIECDRAPSLMVCLHAGRHYQAVAIRVDGQAAVRGIVATRTVFNRRGDSLVQETFLAVNEGPFETQFQLRRQAKEHSAEALACLVRGATRRALGLVVFEPGIWGYPDRRRLDGKGIVPLTLLEEAMEQFGD